VPERPSPTAITSARPRWTLRDWWPWEVV
jgi:hypothetical protein